MVLELSIKVTHIQFSPDAYLKKAGLKYTIMQKPRSPTIKRALDVWVLLEYKSITLTTTLEYCDSQRAFNTIHGLFQVIKLKTLEIRKRFHLDNMCREKIITNE